MGDLEIRGGVQILFLIIKTLYSIWRHKANSGKRQETMLCQGMGKSKMSETPNCPSSFEKSEKSELE